MFFLFILSLAFWEILYYILKYFTNKDREYISRYYSNIYSIFIVYHSLNYCYNYHYYGNTLEDDKYFEKINILTATYALYDSYRAFKKKEIQYIVHHFIMFICVLPMFTLNNHPKYYHYYIARALSSESSTIFLNNCWLLIKNNKLDTSLFKVNSLLTLLCFTFFRIINFTLIIYNIYYLEYYNYILCALPLTLMNYYWYYKLILKYISVL